MIKYLRQITGIILVFLVNFSLQVSDLTDVRIFFYGSSLLDIFGISVSNLADFSSIPTSKFDPSKKTEIFIHGLENARTAADTVLNAYVTNKNSLNINVAYIEWRNCSDNCNDFKVFENLNSIADTAREILKSCKSQGLDIATTHLVGYNMGTNIAGRIGRWFKDSQSVSFSRITGLDPADYMTFGKIFFFLYDVKPLERTDATFVDVIHTNTRAVGDGKVHGHVDFYPNGGKSQPGCFKLTLDIDFLWYCGPDRSWRYYAESIGKPNAFISKQCSSDNFKDSKCQGPVTSPMGYYATPPVPAVFGETLNFFCATNSKEPFSKT
jgi:hypothetical protein